VCTGGYSRGYIRHLVSQKEMLGGILLSLHNVYFLVHLMDEARTAILEGRYGAFVNDWLASEAADDY
jgi:queuine tRNA-ribosyltransferase